MLDNSATFHCLTHELYIVLKVIEQTINISYLLYQKMYMTGNTQVKTVF